MGVSADVREIMAFLAILGFGGILFFATFGSRSAS